VVGVGSGFAGIPPEPWAASLSVRLVGLTTMSDGLSMEPSYASQQESQFGFRPLFHSMNARNRSARSASEIGAPRVLLAWARKASKLPREALSVAFG
jgi:hypothetical protein